MLSQSASLMEILARKAGCEMLSDLRHLSLERRKQLALEITSIPSVDFSLREWNDALHHVAQAPLALSVEDARTRLMEYLDPSEKNAPKTEGQERRDNL